VTTLVRLLAAYLALSLGACAVPAAERSEQSSATRHLSAQEYAAALRTAERGFTWPEDRRPDIGKVIGDSGPTDGELAQAGLETVVLSIVHACAWYLSWSDAVTQGRTELAGRRLPVLSSLPVAKLDPDSATVAEQIAASARAGDPQPAIGYAQANCDNVRWVEIPG
jgi:hypothetical protein